MHVVFHFAYLDPGTGSLIIQSLIGGAAGVAVFGRRILASIKLKLTGKETEASEVSADATINKSDTTKQ